MRLRNEGSKSEGYYAFLVRDRDGDALRLTREGVPPADDPLFAALDGREVVATGEMSHGWLVIQSIDEIIENQ